MRASEFITEAKTIHVNDFYSNGLPAGDFKMWANPRLIEMQALVKKYTLRGLAWSNLLVVWDANKAIHVEVDDYLEEQGITVGTMPTNGAPFVMDDADDMRIADWEGTPTEINNLFFLSEDDEELMQMKSFKRSVGIR